MGEVKYTDEGRVKLYVGSLPFDTRAPDLDEMFAKYGNCSNCKFIDFWFFLCIYLKGKTFRRNQNF